MKTAGRRQSRDVEDRRGRQPNKLDDNKAFWVNTWSSTVGYGNTAPILGEKFKKGMDKAAKQDAVSTKRKSRNVR